MTTEERLITAEDVAKMCGVSVRTVHRMAENGDLPHYRVGRQIRFDVAEVRAALRVPA